MVDQHRVGACAPVVIEVRQRADPLADLDAGDIGADRVDDPGRLNAGAGRELRKAERVLIVHQIRVTPVERERVHGDANIVRAGLLGFAVL